MNRLYPSVKLPWWLVIMLLPLAWCGNARGQPMANVDINWSSRAGVVATGHAMRSLPYQLMVGIDGAVYVDRLGVDPNTPTMSMPLNGVTPSRIGVQFGGHYAWFLEQGWHGWLWGAGVAGISNSKYMAYGGFQAIVDLEYGSLYGDVLWFADGRSGYVYQFGVAAAPYITWLNIVYECNSEDDGGGDPVDKDSRKNKACGLGARLNFKLPRTPVSLKAQGLFGVNNLDGSVSTTLNGRVTLMIQVGG